MKKHITIIVMLVMTIASSAQTKRLTLDECVRVAMQQNRMVRASQQQVARAKALQATAWDIEKTELSLSQDPTTGGSTDNAVTLSQSIDFPTVYMARHRQLKAETMAEESRADVVRNDLSADIASAYYQLLYEEQRLRNLKHQNTVLVEYHNMMRRHLEAGEIRQLEALAAERPLRENRLEMNQAESDVEVARLQLMQLLGTDEQIAPADDSLRTIDFVMPTYLYQQTPEGQYAQSLVNVAERSVSVAKSGYAPSLSLALRHQLVISSWNPYHQDRSRFSEGNFMGFEFGVGIPLFYGATRAKVKAAKMERQQALLQMEQQQRQRQSDYMAAVSRCNAARQRLEYYGEEGLRQADEMVRLAAVEYGQGEISYMEYVNALQGHIDVLQKHAAAVNDYNQSVIALKKICGQSIK